MLTEQEYKTKKGRMTQEFIPSVDSTVDYADYTSKFNSGTLPNLDSGKFTKQPGGLIQLQGQSGLLPINREDGGQTPLIQGSSGLTAGLRVPPPESTTVNADNLGVNSLQFPTLAKTETTFPTSSAPLTPTPDEQAATFAQTPAPTEAEQTQTGLMARFTALKDKLFGKATAQAQAEQAQGLPEKAKAVTDIQAQINQLQNDANAAMIKAQSMGETTSFGNAQIAQIERDRTVKALQLNSFLFAAQGNLATAQSMADKAVKAQFDPMEAEIAYIKEFLDMNEKILTREDKKKADALKIQLDERSRLLEEQKAERKSIYSIGIEAAQAGADAVLLNKIKDATTQEEALQIMASDPNMRAWAEAKRAKEMANTSWQDKVIGGQKHKVLVNDLTGEVIKDLGVSELAKAGEDGLLGGENPQLYAGLGSKTATAVRGQVSAFKTEPTIQNFAVVQEGRNFAKSISDTTTNPADDQGLIYSLAKALDPGSVVREGEYATAQKYAQSWVKAYGKGIEQALLGTGFLSNEARKNIKKTIESKYVASKRSYDNLYKQYVGGINNLTGRSDGTLFLRDYITPEEDIAPASDLSSVSNQEFLQSIPTFGPPTPAQTDNKSFFGGIYNWLTGQ